MQPPTFHPRKDGYWPRKIYSTLLHHAVFSSKPQNSSTKKKMSQCSEIADIEPQAHVTKALFSYNNTQTFCLVWLKNHTSTRSAARLFQAEDKRVFRYTDGFRKTINSVSWTLNKDSKVKQTLCVIIIS